MPALSAKTLDIEVATTQRNVGIWPAASWGRCSPNGGRDGGEPSGAAPLNPGNEINALLFDANNQSGPVPTAEIRVFCENDEPPRRVAGRRESMKGTFRPINTTVTVAIGSRTKDSELTSGRSAGGIWFDKGDARNAALRGPDSLANDAVGCEAWTLCRLLGDTETTAPLDIRLSSQTLYRALTSDLTLSEDSGWRKFRTKKQLLTAVGMLRARQGATSLTLITRTDAHTLGGLRELLREGLAKTHPDLEDAPAPPADPALLTPSGAKLSQLTQSRAYELILAERDEPTREPTRIMLERTRASLAEIIKGEPTDDHIWNSLRTKNLPVRTKAFLWRAMHDSYRLGRFWAHITNYEGRQFCQVCGGVDETLEHILLECEASGQAVVWQAAEAVWRRRKLEWPELSLGLILGSGMMKFKTREGERSLPGADRLYQILIAESAHVIWILRCRWRTQEGADPEKIPTPEEVRNVWEARINKCIHRDRMLTRRSRFGGAALDYNMVERTWRAVLTGQEHLPDDWITNTGVLVGIGVRRPPGRNR